MSYPGLRDFRSVRLKDELDQGLDKQLIDKELETETMDNDLYDGLDEAHQRIS